MSEGERQLRDDEETDRESEDSVLRCLLPVACKGFVVGAGLHVGQVLISGVVSRKLLRE